jgi:hypothetical protein
MSPCILPGYFLICIHQGIDDDLRNACEGLITECARPMVSLLRSWIDEPAATNVQTKALINTSEFRSVCERDLRVGVLRMRLYLEDEKTVSVLSQHVRDRIVEEYALFRSMMWGKRNAKGEGGASSAPDDNLEVFSLEDLKVYLRGICDDVQQDLVSESSGSGQS